MALARLQATTLQQRARSVLKWALLTGFLVGMSIGFIAGRATAAPSCAYRLGGALPDHKCTPGLVNRDVTQKTIHSTICVSGWTTTVRPSSSVTSREKTVSMGQYGSTGSASAYEYDHLIPLELGGAVNDPRNLWPEPHSALVTSSNGTVTAQEGAYMKDAVENKLKRLVCNGSMSLSAARTIMRTDWRKGQ